MSSPSFDALSDEDDKGVDDTPEMGSNFDSEDEETTDGGETPRREGSQSDDKNNNYKSPASSSSRKTLRKTKRLNVKRTYGLRPRTQLRRPSYDLDADDKDQQHQPESPSKGPKVRGTVVAKYRRLTANARERQRMKEINTAFSTLQGVLPVLENKRQPSGSASSRASMTKIRTLRHAASYIQALSDLLTSGIDKEKDQSSTFTTTIVTTTTLYQTTTTTSSHLSTSTNLLQPQISSFLGSSSNHPPQTGGESLEERGENAPLSWEDVQTADEELFSLLEKEVMSLRKGVALNDENNPNLGGINWSDDLPPLG